MRLTVMTTLGTMALGCSTSTSASGPDQPSATSASDCGGDLPAQLSIAEGGFVSLPRSAGVVVEGQGGVIVTESDVSIDVRAPYLSGVDGEPALRLSCGRSVPIELRPLRWTKLAEWEEGAGAPAREYGGWWMDPTTDGALVVFGGYHYVPKQFTPANDAWRFDLRTGAWSPLAGSSLPTLPGGRVAPIPGERSVYYHGGSTPTDRGSIDTRPSLYRLDFDDERMTATQVEKLGGARGSYTGAFIHDAKRARWLSICGLDTDFGVHCRVDAFTSEEGFTRVTTAGTAPKGRYGFHYAYDDATDRVILFGGQIGLNNEAIDDETWALDLAVDPPTWSRLRPGGAKPMRRRNGAFALDPIGHRLFVWGGTPDGADSVKGIQALSLDRGTEEWADIPTPAEVPSRTSGIGATDLPRGQLLFGFGNDDLHYHDLWALDVANGQSTTTTSTSRAMR